MATLTIRPDLVSKIQEFAAQENRSVEEILETMITHYQPTVIPDQPENGLQRLAASLQAHQDVEWSGPTDASERVKEILDAEYADYLESRLTNQESNEKPNSDR